MTISGVGPATGQILGRVGLHNIDQLIHYFPRKYDDYSSIIPIRSVRPGVLSIRATISQLTGRYARRGMHVTEAIATDKSGSVRLVWFNQPYRVTSIKAGEEYFISGTYKLSHQKFSITNPRIERVSEMPVQSARILPVYPENKQLKSTQIRKIMSSLAPTIAKIPETLPRWLVDEYHLYSRSSALLGLHLPDSLEVLQAAKHRLSFEEIFELTLTALLIKQQNLQSPAIQIPFSQNLAKNFVSHLPFQLTDDQRKTVWQVYQDMARNQPMNRLVEGDVGSGKTVVAAMAALMAIEQGYQVAFMAPTELLARQHAETIFNLFEPLGFANHVSLLVGSMTAAQKKQVHNRMTDGTVRMIIGTHALIQEKVDMHSLGLVIIDEQHRFGVEQRKKLLTKAGHMPHVLSMTATPIPRTLALTLYGELDISVIASKPRDRLAIKTTLISPNSRAKLVEDIDVQISLGRQVFWVCPLISQSSTMADVTSAEEVYQSISNKHFKHRRIGILHGKMKAEQKTQIMQEFIDKKIDILVATTVVEVGVDVPNATVMVIENADRFGLAQLHQLRGRVGRSKHQAYCYAVMSDSKAPSKRLRAFEQTTDGFRLSELDLEIRGPGAIYGTLQHGELNLKIATLTDTKLVAEARQAAQQFIDRGEKLVQYNHLHKRVLALQAITSLN